MVDDEQVLEELASTMDASAALLPWLPELFAGLEDLGVRASDVVALVSAVDLPESTTVLDLGCGKGSALIALAQGYGISGRGVDGLEPFLVHARARASDLSLGDRLGFECQDVRRHVPDRGAYDLVMMLALGPVFGDARQTIERLRMWTRPGGYMLIDEAYLPSELASDDVHWELGLSVDELVLDLTAHGDEVVAELVYDTPEYRAWCGEMSAKIQVRAVALAERIPELAQELTDFAQRQSEETQAADSPFIGSLFLLRRRGD